MIRIIDTCHQINQLFDHSVFNYSRWEAYINSVYDHSAHIFKEEMDGYIQSGQYTFERDFLPVLNAVYENPKLDILHNSFIEVTGHLSERVTDLFGKEPDIDIVLYLGLCNAAGWVTNINHNDTILLGVEKIIELDWTDVNSMYGLICHELGHAYHGQYGVLKQEAADDRQKYIWQLFTEGAAMYFEQALAGDFSYYHQDVNGWADWCGEHFRQILEDFDRDISGMKRYEQRYFGDWCDYYGHSDVGYYLGSRFVQHCMEKYEFDELICLPLDAVCELYMDFVRRYGAVPYEE